MNILFKLLKQSKPRLWLGGLRDMLQRGQSYYGMFNVFIGLATLYTVREALIRSYVPWINFFILLGIVATVQLVVIIIDYKWIYPSQIAFHQHEAYKHRSLIRRDLELERDAAIERQKQLGKKLDEVLEAIDVWNKKNTSS